jgi:hypothetical protein
MGGVESAGGEVERFYYSISRSVDGHRRGVRNSRDVAYALRVCLCVCTACNGLKFMQCDSWAR